MMLGFFLLSATHRVSKAESLETWAHLPDLGITPRTSDGGRK